MMRAEVFRRALATLGVEIVRDHGSMRLRSLTLAERLRIGPLDLRTRRPVGEWRKTLQAIAALAPTYQRAWAENVRRLLIEAVPIEDAVEAASSEALSLARIQETPCRPK